MQDDTPLHMAAANGHADTVDELMLLRADPRATNGRVCDLALLQNHEIGSSAELGAMKACQGQRFLFVHRDPAISLRTAACSGVLGLPRVRVVSMPH